MPSPSAKPLAAAIAAALLLLTAPPADAQLTARSLIGDSVSEPDSPRYSDIAGAIKTFSNRDFLGAEKWLEDAKEKNPKLPPVGVMMAKMHAITGNKSAVRPALEKSIDSDADDPEPYLLLAESTLQAGQTIEADALFEKAVKLISEYDTNPKRKRKMAIRAYGGRSAVAERRKKWTAAEKDLRAWIEMDPENATALTRLGQTLCMLDRIDEGRQQFVKAKELDENRASPYVMTATMLERAGRQSEAIAEFGKAYNEDKTNEVTLVTFAQSLIRAGELDKAAKVLAAARSAAPSSFNVWLLSGVHERMSGKTEAAEQSLRQALAIQPGSRDAYDQIAQLLASADSDELKARGLQYAATGSKVFPDNADMKVTLAWALYQTGRSREATQALRGALQQSGGRLGADARVLVAKILMAGNQTENARRLLTSAIAEETGIFVQRAEAEELLKSLN